MVGQSHVQKKVRKVGASRSPGVSAKGNDVKDQARRVDGTAPQRLRGLTDRQAWPNE